MPFGPMRPVCFALLAGGAGRVVASIGWSFGRAPASGDIKTYVEQSAHIATDQNRRKWDRKGMSLRRGGSRGCRKQLPCIQITRDWLLAEARRADSFGFRRWLVRHRRRVGRKRHVVVAPVPRYS